MYTSLTPPPRTHWTFNLFPAVALLAPQTRQLEPDATNLDAGL